MKAKKSLGQNFLKSIPALNAIIKAGEVSREDIILEIGPGKGALTEKLLEKAKYVIAVEKDESLFKFLTEKFEKEIKNKKLILINSDILKLDIQKTDYKFFSGPRVAPIKSERLNQTNSKNFIPFFGKNYKIIANIPYNITGAILKKFLTEKNQPERMVLMLQNEVAKRIVARDNKESILSISVKAYGEPKIIMKVPARYFSPAPKVDSAIIIIKNISRELFIKNNTNEEIFWKIIHAGFAHKRKKLSSNLKIFLKNLKYQGEPLVKIKNGSKASVLASVFSVFNALGNKRAEELLLEDWVNLVKEYSK